MRLKHVRFLSTIYGMGISDNNIQDGQSGIELYLEFHSGFPAIVLKRGDEKCVICNVGFMATPMSEAKPQSKPEPIKDEVTPVVKEPLTAARNAEDIAPPKRKRGRPRKVK